MNKKDKKDLVKKLFPAYSQKNELKAITCVKCGLHTALWHKDGNNHLGYLYYDGLCGLCWEKKHRKLHNHGYIAALQNAYIHYPGTGAGACGALAHRRELIYKLFRAVLVSPNLNKHPKIPVTPSELKCWQGVENDIHVPTIDAVKMHWQKTPGGYVYIADGVPE